MRIALVVPPSGFLLDARVFPSLGVLRVGAALEAAGHDVRVVDMSGEENVELILAMAEPADWYGVTATTPQLPGAVRVARWVRTNTDARVVLGGPHVTLINAAAKRGNFRASGELAVLRDKFDTLVAGDGEMAVFATLEAGSGQLVDADVPGGALFLTTEQLDGNPLPARHLIDLDGYHYAVDGKRATSLVAQLGCPFSCGFCGGRASPTFRRVRLRSSDQVVAELRHLAVDRGYHGFMWMDDELNVNPGVVPLMKAIADLQDDLGVEFRMRGFVKSQLLTEEQAKWMHAAGFRELLVGFEAADDRILRNINKKATRAQNERCLEIARNAGLRVKALMSVGHPGETPETIEAVRSWLLAQAPADFDVTIITVYPGTPYHDDAVERDGALVYEVNGDRLYFRALDFTREVPFYKGVPGSYRSFVWTDALNVGEIVEMRDSVERDVRGKLGIPWPKKWEATTDHSMGQSA